MAIPNERKSMDISEINAEGTQLRKHQLKMLEMLKYVDKLCRKHDIPYYLSGGTLLGAVRHQGFIPWDDDLDIILMKKDFRRLLNVLRNEPSVDYVLQCHQTDPYYIAPYAKLRMKNTQIREWNENDIYYRYRGIYIDIFFLEPAVPFFHYIAHHLQNILIRFAGLNPTRRIKPILTGSFYMLLYRFLFPVFNMFSLLLRRDRLSYPLGSFFNTQFEKESYICSSTKHFEDRLFPVPLKWDTVLRAQYGEYHILPDLDKIEPHIQSISF